MKAIMDAVNHSLQTKLQTLISFLSQVNRGFDSIAEEIDCRNLKTALIALAVESRQYAHEIRKQLDYLNINIPQECSDQFWEKIEHEIHEQAINAKGGEIMSLCNNCEIYFGKLYEDVLKEYMPFKALKDIITYQLFAAQCAFMKIRLLNAMRFSH